MSRRWTEWQTHPQNKRLYRARYDSAGVPEYEWADEQSSSSAPQVAQHQPAKEKSRNRERNDDRLASGFKNLDLGPEDRDRGHSSYSEDDEQYRSSVRHDTDSASRQHSRKDKNVRYAAQVTNSQTSGQTKSYPADIDDEQQYRSPDRHDTDSTSRQRSRKDNKVRYSAQVTNSQTSGQTKSHPADIDEDDERGPIIDTAGTGVSRTSSYTTHYSPSYPIQTTYVEPTSKSYDGRKSYTEPQSYPGSSSRTSRQPGRHHRRDPVEEELYEEEEEEEDPLAIPSHGHPRRTTTDKYTWTYSSMPQRGQAYVPDDDDEDEGASTPRADQHAQIPVYDDTSNDNPLDPRYRIEHSTKFQPGRIFLVQYAEPFGGGNENDTAVSGRRVVRDKTGTPFYTGFRRLIVIANDEGHCTCVPILTYGRKACNKNGVKPRQHGIIHHRNKPAKKLPGEPDLGFVAVRADLYEGEKLSKESRVNYSKLMSTEHNTKVLFIGNIVDADFEMVQDAVDSCWEDKERKRQTRGKKKVKSRTK